jgi:hypothetical protein
MTERKVGYKSPPLETRFAKGRSGNPHGRPKRNHQTLAAAIEAVMRDPIVYFELGRRKIAPNKEVLIKRLIQLALKGNNPKAAGLILEIYGQSRSSGSSDGIQVVVEGWMPTHRGQTGEQKTREHAAASQQKTGERKRE